MFEFIITRPMGFLIENIYGFVQNYGMAIIIFTILIKLVLLPLTIKSQKAMKKQQLIQPLIAELQKKYANDKEKLQTETMKVYKENNVSMTGGCLPLFVQMPILIGLYQVIQKPLSYLVNVDFSSADVINKVIKLRDSMPDVWKLKGHTMQQLADTEQIKLAKWSEVLNGNNDPWVINFNFLGMDLSNTPMVAIDSIMSGKFSDFSIISLLAIPLVAVLTTWYSSKQMQAQSKKNVTATTNEDPAAQMSKSMTMMMPLMTGFFTFTLPSGIGIYWIVGNVVQIVQQYFINKHLDEKEDETIVKISEKHTKNSKKRR